MLYCHVIYPGLWVLPCQRECGQSLKTGSHRHCPGCNMVNHRLDRWRTHVTTCKTCPEYVKHDKEGPTKTDEQPRMDSGRDISAVTAARNLICSSCNKKFSTTYNLKVHFTRFHKETIKKSIQPDYHHKSVLVDGKRGIYLVSKTMTGVSFPLHVQKRTVSPNCISLCESDDCIASKQIAAWSKKTAFECFHVKSVEFASSPPPVSFDFEVLEKMTTSKGGIIEESTKEALKAISAMADSKGTPLAVPFNFDRDVRSTRHIFLSVYVGEQRHWCRLGRTVVYYDAGNESLHCACCSRRSGCLHKYVMRWFLLGNLPDHDFKVKNIELENVEAISSENPEFEETGEETVHSQDYALDDSINNTTSENIKFMCDYLLNQKRIPVNFPEELLDETNMPTSLKPVEENCFRCQWPLLEFQKHKGKILTVKTPGIIHGL